MSSLGRPAFLGILLLLVSVSGCRFGYREVLGESDDVHAGDSGMDPPDEPDASDDVDASTDDDDIDPVADAGEDAATADAGLIITPGPDAGEDAGPTSTPVMFSAGGTTAQMGGTGGGAFGDDCPAGHAIIGYQGYLSASYSWVTRIAAVCARVTIESAGPAVVWSDPVALPEHASDGDMAWNRTCAAGEVIVGFAGYAGQYLDQITFHCAPLTVTGQVGAYTLSLGSATALAGIGQAGGASFAPVTCPSGQVATGFQGRSGNWLDAIALRCSAPQPE